jgi:hypothetical protein
MKKNIIPRRKFLGSVSAAFALLTIQTAGFSCKNGSGRKKMILSFYMDDTNPEIVKAEAYKEFLDYCHTKGIKGESSIIPGTTWSLQKPHGQRVLILIWR